MTKTYLKEFDEQQAMLAQLMAKQYLPIEFGVDIPKHFVIFGRLVSGFLGKIDIDEGGLFVEYERQHKDDEG